MKEVAIKARGKVNLSLNICGVRGGLHLLDSVVASADVFDTVHLVFRHDKAVRVRFSGAAEIPAENSVTKALAVLQKFVPDLGADIYVEKGIPLAGGLGGSSADAAAVFFAAAELLPERFRGVDLRAESAAVGSDVPVLTTGGAARMQGAGEKIERLAAKSLYLAIADAGGGVSSGAAYRVFDELYPQKAFAPSDNEKLIAALGAGDTAGVAREANNALTAAAVRLCPAIESTLRLLGESAAAAFMTGSGSCCCGIYANGSAATRAAAACREKGKWAIATVTTLCGNEWLH